MRLTGEIRQFIQTHGEDDLTKLLLSASRYPGIDVPFAVDQIASRRQVREKLPFWYANEKIIYPSRVAAEQCSSQPTAMYKQRLVKDMDQLCDLTGGMGVDSFFFSGKAKHVTYIERFTDYCEAARANFEVLHARNITVWEGDARSIVNVLPEMDVFYIDPARRGDADKRVYALSDCEPDLPSFLPQLFAKAPKVIAKLSPMIDISHTLQLLPDTTEIHILSVRNECKELLFVLERDTEKGMPRIYAWNNRSNGAEESFDFTLEEEKDYPLVCLPQVKAYLYEPNASVLKGGAFKSITRLGVEKLHASSHLYTSEYWINNFPGRIFQVDEVYPFNGKLLKLLAREIPQANITIRNFPLTVADLRKRTKIKEGGTVYLFATTLANNEKVIIRGTRL